VPRALIAGAGIGGLTTALALSQIPFDVTIFERAPKLEEFGAGMQLTPNATRILSKLGVLEAIRTLATEPSAIRLLRGRDDAELARLEIADAAKRWGAPYLVIHRADLQRALFSAVAERANVELRLGIEVGGIGEEANGVAMGLKRGALVLRETGDLAIGADGLRSRLRERLGRGAMDAAIFSGRVAFRAMVPADSVAARWSAPEVTLRLGAGAHLVQYPLRGASLVNVVAVIESGWRGEKRDSPWDGEADRPALARAFAGWSRETRSLLAAAESWRAWPLFHREPIARFDFGRVALIGDAAHPMLPFLAQGAAQAIEDAGALARRLGESEDVGSALTAYSRDRTPRTMRVQREASAQARLYHLSGPMALARDLTMRAMGPERLIARYDWLYAA
jgi:salicylate hydroxylase